MTFLRILKFDKPKNFWYNNKKEIKENRTMANNYCVYMHKNKINNKIYVGQTCNRKSRWSPISYKDSSYFYAAIFKIWLGKF